MAKDINDLLDVLGKQPGDKMDVRQLGKALLKSFDGVEGLAKLTRQAYDANPTGNANSIRIISDVMGIIRDCAKADSEDVDDVTQEELRAHIRALTGEQDDGA